MTYIERRSRATRDAAKEALGGARVRNQTLAPDWLAAIDAVDPLRGGKA